MSTPPEMPPSVKDEPELTAYQPDNNLAAIRAYRDFIRRDLVTWFVALIVSIVMFGLAASKWQSVTSKDLNRDFVAVNSLNESLERTSLKKPHPTFNDDEVEQHLKDSIQACMTFDYLNYGIVNAYCSRNVFTLNQFENEQFTAGQRFYRAIEKSGLITDMNDNQSAINVDITKVNLIEKGVVTREQTYLRFGDIVTRQRSAYTYTYDVTIRILLIGSEIDAPIIYRVNLERMSELVRKDALGIRNIVSKE